jgi:hypothetical protein
MDSKVSFSEIVVPTTDSVRNTFLLDMLLTRDKHVLMVGNTGTGKTINIAQYLSGAAKVGGKVIPSNVIPLTLMFSANTSANMVQDLLDSKMDKRKKGVFGPAAGKRFYIHVRGYLLQYISTTYHPSITYTRLHCILLCTTVYLFLDCGCIIAYIYTVYITNYVDYLQYTHQYTTTAVGR